MADLIIKSHSANLGVICVSLLKTQITWMIAKFEMKNRFVVQSDVKNSAAHQHSRRASANRSICQSESSRPTETRIRCREMPQLSAKSNSR